MVYMYVATQQTVFTKLWTHGTNIIAVIHQSTTEILLVNANLNMLSGMSIYIPAYGNQK